MSIAQLTAILPVGPFFTALSFAWGACVGSFLNVCIYRIPREMSVVKPRSQCPHCGRAIPWYLNIPLVSYIALRGKCAYCGKPITARYFIVELLTATLFLLVWLKFDPCAGSTVLGLVPVSDWKLIPVYWLVVSGLVLGTFVDFEHLIIPDRVTLGGIAAGLAISLLIPSLHDRTQMLQGLMWSAIGATTGWALLWAMGVLGRVIFKKEAMGFGDVKLMGAVGAFLGPWAVFFNILISSLAGSIVGITLVAAGRKEMQSRIPYGPYIALAAVLWILWGPAWWQMYIDIITPPKPPYL